MPIHCNPRFSVGVSVACLLLISSSFNPSSSTASTNAPEDTFDCAIYPSSEAHVGTNSPGIIERLQVDRSDTVARGDVIAVLDSTAERATVALARARAEAASEIEFRRASADHSKRQLSRIERLNKSSRVSSQDHDDRKTEAELGAIQLQQAIDSQRILALELARAEVALSHRTVRSPFDGIVVERYKSAGEHVDDQPLIKLAKIDPLHIETILATDHLGTIKSGMLAQVWSDAAPEERWSATVDRVDAIVDVASGTFGVRLVLPNPDHKLVAGIRCQLVFQPQVEMTEPAPKSALSASQSFAEQYLNYENYKRSIGLTPVFVTARASEDKAQPLPVLAAAAARGNTATADRVTDLGACLNTQPFTDREAAEQYQKSLQQHSFDIAIEEKDSYQEVGSLVRSPMLNSRKEVHGYVSGLEAAGVDDYLLPSGAPPLRISLGAYREQVSAQAMLDQVAAVGLAVELAAWRQKQSEYFIVAQSAGVPLCE